LGYGCLAAYVGAFTIRFLAGKWVLDKTGYPAFVDFVWIWIGGRFALMRDAAGVFNHSTFSAAQASLIGNPPPRGFPYQYWVYPPTMLLVVAPFALLSYVAAFFVWIAATLCIYLAGVYAILPYALSIVLALLPCAVVMNAIVGQAAFLTTGLFGFAFIFMCRRPYLSGICLGLLTYKPQLGLFFPLALVITRQWRVIAGATTAGLLFAGVATVVFGPHAWALFVRSVHAHNPATFLPTYKLDAMNQTVFGLMHWGGAGLGAAWAAHLAVALLATALACMIWLQPVPYSLKAAAFSLGALIVTPYMLIYDLTAVSVPAAFLIEDALAHGFIPGERLILLCCFLSLFLFTRMPVGSIVLLALMGLVVRRARYATKAV
jgi:arabinofuranan 3-O-arabinosyltransferase